MAPVSGSKSLGVTSKLLPKNGTFYTIDKDGDVKVLDDEGMMQASNIEALAQDLVSGFPRGKVFRVFTDKPELKAELEAKLGGHGMHVEIISHVKHKQKHQDRETKDLQLGAERNFRHKELGPSR